MSQNVVWMHSEPSSRMTCNLFSFLFGANIGPGILAMALQASCQHGTGTLIVCLRPWRQKVLRLTGQEPVWFFCNFISKIPSEYILRQLPEKHVIYSQSFIASRLPEWDSVPVFIEVGRFPDWQFGSRSDLLQLHVPKYRPNAFWANFHNKT